MQEDETAKLDAEYKIESRTKKEASKRKRKKERSERK